jgi:LysM repeat protein
MKKTGPQLRIVSAALVGLLAFLAGCGQVGVITPEATQPPETRQPLASPTPTDAGPPPAPVQRTPVGATPTITPTPIIHEVQAGETLGAIAEQYGVSVQALQAANGIENPLLLQIGQDLVIPIGEGGEVEVPSLLLPTPTPLPFSIRGVSFFETPVGSLWCLGEVVNTTAVTLTNALVKVTLFDSTGSPVAEGDAFAAADIIPPTARAPFGILFIAPPPDFASHQVTILRGEAAGAQSAGYLSLAVVEAEGSPSGGQFEVTGTVRNGDPRRVASRAIVVITTYDAQGQVTGFRQHEVEGGALAPGEAAPFRVLVSAHGDVPAEFSAIAFAKPQGE